MSNASATHSHGSTQSSRKRAQDRLQTLSARGAKAELGPAQSTARQRMTDRAHDGARPISVEARGSAREQNTEGPMSKRAENVETTSTAPRDRPEAPPAVSANLARLRNEQGLGLEQLAAKSGLPRHTLRALEAGSEEPTIKTLWSLANALGVPFSLLIANERPSSPPPAPRGGARKLLASKDGPRSSEVYEIKLAGHGSERALPRVAGALENALVTSGYAEIEVAGTRHRLSTGESVSFAADIERRYFNPKAEPATLYLVISEPAE